MKWTPHVCCSSRPTLPRRQNLSVVVRRAIRGSFDHQQRNCSGVHGSSPATSRRRSAELRGDDEDDAGCCSVADSSKPADSVSVTARQVVMRVIMAHLRNLERSTPQELALRSSGYAITSTGRSDPLFRMRGLPMKSAPIRPLEDRPGRRSRRGRRPRVTGPTGKRTSARRSRNALRSLDD